MITFNSPAQVDLRWTVFKAALTSRGGLSIQYFTEQPDTESERYTIYAFDGPTLFICRIWKGVIPSVEIGQSYTQFQNDADKLDFETSYKPKANRSIARGDVNTNPTYVAEVALAGANNKDMISNFNPVGSGKIIKIYEAWAVVPVSSGATVIIPFELRSATAITTGSSVNKKPLDSGNPVASAEVRSAPTGITDHASMPIFWTWVEQINTAQGGTENMSHTLHNESANAIVQPVTLRPGEGIYLRQVANNTSTFRMGFLWTEETT